MQANTSNCTSSVEGALSAIVRLTDLHEVIDALYRFAEGQDRGDRELFESAFALDATVDFTGPARRLGVEVPPFEGLTTIRDMILGTVTSLDTTHTVTNPRVSIEGDRAILHALVEAQHLPSGGHDRHLLLKNLYTVRLSRAGERWVIDNVWFTGDPPVFFPPSLA